MARMRHRVKALDLMPGLTVMEPKQALTVSIVEYPTKCGHGKVHVGFANSRIVWCIDAEDNLEVTER